VEMLLQSSMPSSLEAALSFTYDHGKRDLPFEWINTETRQCCINRNELSQDGSEILIASTTLETSGSSYICKRRKLLKNSVVIFPLEVEVNEVPVFAAKTGPSDIQVEDTIDDGTSASSLSADKSVLEFNGGNASVLNSQNFSKNPCSEVKVFIKPDVNTNSKSVSFGRRILHLTVLYGNQIYNLVLLSKLTRLITLQRALVMIFRVLRFQIKNSFSKNYAFLY
jgi:hypothetical protein